MFIAQVVIFLNIFFWALPPFRHISKNFFLFFLVFAFMDPIVVIINIFINLDAFRVYSFGSYILLHSIIKRNKKQYMLNLVGGLLLLPCSIFLSVKINALLVFAFLLIILFIFIKKLIIDINKIFIINSFYIVLVFYVITLLLKIFYFLLDSQQHIIFAYLTSAFEIIFALFFTIFHDNDERLMIKLTGRRDALEI